MGEHEGRNARRFCAYGTVQGAGFWPFVHRTAVGLRLDGWVADVNGRVEGLVVGSPLAIGQFAARLREEAPGPARVRRVSLDPARGRPPAAGAGFTVRAHSGARRARAAREVPSGRGDLLGTIEQQDAKYTTAYGSESLRQGIADMLRPLFSQELDWHDIFAASGVSATLECLAFALKDADVLCDGDRVLLPAPYWQGFNWCFEQRPGLVCVPVHLKERGAENFELTLEDIQRAYRTQPEPPKLLVLTNPNNPLGDTYAKELLEEIYAWVLNETGMHIISDEMYAHSRLTGSAPEFMSALALDAYRAIDGARDRVHVVWGFAKDFGRSGFKAGAIISRSPAVHLAMTGVADKQETLSWFSPFDSLKHFVIGRMLQTRVGGKSYPLELMEQYRGLLTTACDTVRAELDKHGFAYRFRKGQNTAQFLWLDLRRYLPKPGAPEIPAHAGPHFPQPDRIPGEFAVEGDKAQELTLPLLFPEIDSREEWLRWALANHAQVQLLPGQLLSCAEPGYFRLCFTAVETQEVVESVQRMGAFLH